MRSQVQVLAGPPAIPAGHGARGGEPGAPAAGLGRAGAARPSRRPAGPPPRAVGTTTTTHRGRPPSPSTAAPGRCGTSRCSPLRATAQPPAPALRTPAQPAWSSSRSSAAVAARPHPGPGPPATPLTNARPRQRRPRPGLLGRRPSRSTAWQPTGTRPVPMVQVASRSDLVPNATACGGTRWTRPDGRGGQQPAGHRRGGHRTAGHRTGWTLDALDTGRPDTGRLDRRTRVTEPLGGHHMVDVDRRQRPTAGAGWTLRRAAAGWASNQPGQRGSTHDLDRPGHRRDRRLRVLRRRPAGASAHCCPRTITGRA
jgi:hypothetical protein